LIAKVKISLFNFNTLKILGMESPHASIFGHCPSEVPQLAQGKFMASIMQHGESFTKATSHTLSLHVRNLKLDPFPLSICCSSLHFQLLHCLVPMNGTSCILSIPSLSQFLNFERSQCMAGALTNNISFGISHHPILIIVNKANLYNLLEFIS
jgi:hypothetical protein